MSFLTIMGIAFGLAMDAFAVSLAAGLRLGICTFRPVFRLSFHFGLFQFMMPIIGWWGGLSLAGWTRSLDHWIAFGLLELIGGKMLFQSLLGDKNIQPCDDCTRGLSLVILSVATSMDALAVGISMAMLKVSVWFPSIIIGLVAAGMTVMAMVYGCRLGARFGKGMEILGALILIGIGIKILAEHLAA